MGSISVACYRPKPGCEEGLLELVRNHLPPLRAERLITDRASIVMRAGDGTIIEVLEWVSQEAIAGAHSNSAVLDLWKRFEAVCTYVVPSNTITLTESANLLHVRGRARDQADWAKDARLLADAGAAAYKAAQAIALAAVATPLDQSCTACHKQYRPDVFPRQGGPQ